MGLKMNERRAVTREVAGRYQKASKKQRGNGIENGVKS